MGDLYFLSVSFHRSKDSNAPPPKNAHVLFPINY